MADSKKFHYMTENPVSPDLSPKIIDETARQKALDALNIVDTPPEQRFDRITKLAKQMFGVETAAISLIDHDRQWFKSRIGTDLIEGKRSDAFCDFTIRSSEVFAVSDATKDPRFKDNPLVLGDPNIRFYAGYPLEASGGEHVGALCIFDPNPRVFTDAEKNLLRDLALWVQKEMTIEEEFSRAAEVQAALMPKQSANLDGYDVAGGCASARAVGGDFYDWYNVDEGEAFTLVDVMGKGMAAAIIAATVRAVLRAGSKSNDLVKAVEIAANTLDSDLNNLGSFATLFHARLNTETGLVRYIDAGHGLSFLLHEDGTTVQLTSEFPPLGTGIETAWEEKSFVLEPGDTLVAISDGVLDLFDGTVAGLRDAEPIFRNARNSQEVVDNVLSLAGVSSTDDVTILLVHRNKPRATFAI